MRTNLCSKLYIVHHFSILCYLGPGSKWYDCLDAAGRLYMAVLYCIYYLCRSYEIKLFSIAL